MFLLNLIVGLDEDLNQIVLKVVDSFECVSFQAILRIVNVESGDVLETDLEKALSELVLEDKITVSEIDGKACFFKIQS